MTCPVLAHKKCPGAVTCETCGGEGFFCHPSQSSHCYENEPPCPCPDVTLCTTCHGTGQTCESAGKACRIMDAEVHGLGVSIGSGLITLMNRLEDLRSVGSGEALARLVRLPARAIVDAVYVALKQKERG